MYNTEVKTFRHARPTLKCTGNAEDEMTAFIHSNVSLLRQDFLRITNHFKISVEILLQIHERPGMRTTKAIVLLINRERNV